MRKIQNEHLTGERALFRLEDAEVDSCLFDDGESPLKEGRNLVVTNTTFGWKYPLWYGKGHKVSHCTFLEMSRSGIWYTDSSEFGNLDIIAPKEFRRCKDIVIRDTVFHNAQETLWNCQNVRMENVTAKGDYLGFNGENFEVKNLKLDGNYPFDGGKNIHVVDSVLNSKDAFWNCENVLIENSVINGEYFSWNSKNITLVNCTITSHQGFCYMDHVKLVNCRILPGSDLIFEYCSNIDADVRTPIDSVKNPISGTIRCGKIGELILDPDAGIDPKKTVIEQKN